MTDHLTTGPGVYRVSILFEKVDAVTGETIGFQKYRSDTMVDLKSAHEVAELSIRARDRAIDSRKRLSRPAGTSPSTPPTSKSPVT